MTHALKSLLLAVLLAGCGAPGTNLEATQTDLVKETYTVQAPDSGRIEFAIPDHDPETGLPLIQTYEIDDAKFSHVLMSMIPHQMDSRGVVYVTADPNRWVLVVVIR